MWSFINAWGLIVVSLCYTFFVGKLVRKGIWRQILIIPVFIIFLIVPLLISSLHLLCITAFFITWLANFKIFLFALGRGPLSSNPKPLSLPIFLVVSCMPIKIQLSPKPFTSHSNSLCYIKKLACLVLITKLHDYNNNLPEKAVLILYAIHTYFALELILTTIADVVRAMSNLELEPQFNKPHLATSLQNFWGRRWNLMVTGILRPTVYEPMIQLFSMLGCNWHRAPAVFVTFVVSGLMHELIFFYIGRLRPDWKVMWFFLVNGFCTAMEIVIKKTVKGRWKFPTVISRVLTIGFVMVTGLWLFFPEFKRCNIFERAFEEYALIGEAATGIRKSMISSLHHVTNLV